MEHVSAAPFRCKGGCEARYCCEGHAELAWASYHRLLCAAADKSGNMAAYNRLALGAHHPHPQPLSPSRSRVPQPRQTD